MIETAGKLRGLWILVFLLAASLWSVHIGRPVDLPAWHEFDYSSIARNFLREGNNILYPRIDWRGNGPGFTEMEFPIIPWVMAQCYRLFGVHEIIGRLLAYAFTLLSLFQFARIARKALPEAASLAACLFFVVNHEVTQVATSIQPESLMLLLYLTAVYYFLDWYERPTWASYWLAALAFCGAMLVKSPAAHLAIFFFVWAMHKEGLKAFRRPELYLFAIASFAPVLWWYSHAAGLWREFHNSMGVSNEDHWIGLDILRRPKVIVNLLSIDVFLVCGGGGLLVALTAIKAGGLKTKANRIALCWGLSIAVYLVVIMRTAGAYWAAYYHVIAVPPVALLFGAGIVYWRQYRMFSGREVAMWSGLVALLTAGMLWLGRNRDLTHVPGVFQDLLIARTSLLGLALLAGLAAALTVLVLNSWLSPVGGSTMPGHQKAAFVIVLTGVASYFFLSGQLLLGLWKRFETPTAEFVCASALKSKLKPNTLIVASGGICEDAGGHRVANDAPNMFYWLDHKGFTTCQGRDSIRQLRAFHQQGAQYFIVDRVSVDSQPGLELGLNRTFNLVERCDVALLYELSSK